MTEESRHSAACVAYELRLEDYLEGKLDAVSAAEVEEHLERCGGCREALVAARLARSLLAEHFAPAAAPAGAFATRVMAGIRAEEDRRWQFWRPLEVLASRLALTAAVVLLILTVFVLEFGSTGRPSAVSSQARATEGWPEPAAQPANPDEVLLALAENGHGR